MTHNPEMRYRCDRCHTDTIQPMDSNGPRAAPPVGWLTLWVDSSTAPATHLCKVCAPEFYQFMKVSAS